MNQRQVYITQEQLDSISAGHEVRIIQNGIEYRFARRSKVRDNLCQKNVRQVSK